MDITTVKEEDALHRAMQLQPKQVVGEEAMVIDLDCMDFRHFGEHQKTRPDGILCCRDRRLATVEIKTSIRPRDVDQLVSDAAKRLEYLADSAGPGSIRQLISQYCLRFGTSQAAYKEFDKSADTKLNLKQVYVIAAHTYAPGVVDALDAAVDVHRSGRFSAELRLVHLQGSVQPLGRVDLDKPAILLSRQIGDGHARYRDNIEITDQHQWGIPDRFGEIKRELLSLLPESLWPDRTMRVKKNPRTGMIHPWGIGSGDLTFEIYPYPNDYHFQLYFGKRKDLCARVAGPVFDSIVSIAKAIGTSPADLDNENLNQGGRRPTAPKVCSWVLKWHLGKQLDNIDLVSRFALFVKAVHPIVDKYIW